MNQSRRGLLTRLGVGVAALSAVAVLSATVPGAAGAAVLAHATGTHAVRVAPTVKVGVFPTGIAVDPAAHTVYVASAVAGLALVNTAACNASAPSGCGHVPHAKTGGSDPIGIAVDEVTHTVYVVNAGSNTVAVLDADTCNAVTPSGCAKPVALVPVKRGPEFLALDNHTDTVYVADTGSDTVAVINGVTCNASVTTGCAKPVAHVKVGSGPFPIEVDQATNTVYTGTFGRKGDLPLINGRTCNGSDVTGCAAPLAAATAGTAPAGIAADSPDHTVYVTDAISGKVTVMNTDTCSTVSTAGCSAHYLATNAGTQPRGAIVDTAAHTLYVTNAVSNSVSMINTARCDAANTTGCAKLAPAIPVGVSPRRVADDPAVSTLYVVNSGAGTLSMINSTTCNATDLHGCPTEPPPAPQRP